MCSVQILLLLAQVSPNIVVLALTNLYLLSLLTHRRRTFWLLT